jgi:hypothetical protein
MYEYVLPNPAADTHMYEYVLPNPAADAHMYCLTLQCYHMYFLILKMVLRCAC